MPRIALAAVLAASTLTARRLAAEPLTLDRALQQLRDGPPGQAMRLRVKEAEGQLVGARRSLSDNPTVTGSLGRRQREPPEGRSLEGGVELLAPMGVPGRRGARIRGVEAAIDAERANAEAALRRAEAEVAVAFFRTLAGTDREQVASAAESAARRAVEALERRHQLKDVALLDVNVGKGALARATALVRTARAERLNGELDLKRLLALEDGEKLELSGNLRNQRRFDLRSLLDRARDRSEVRTLLAQAREADATAAAGRAERWPRVALGASYERDDGANVALGILSVELPFFDRGQTERAVGQARAQRLALEADVSRRVGVAAVRGAHAVYQERLSAAGILEQALPLLDQNQELARKSYEAGQLSLADWLVVRREALDTHLEYLDRLLAAAEAGVALAAAAGVSP